MEVPEKYEKSEVRIREKVPSITVNSNFDEPNSDGMKDNISSGKLESCESQSKNTNVK